MLINQVSKETNLTKKAIEYYAEQGLICPVVLENGYRDYGESDVERLKKVSVLRRLGMSIPEIKAILADETGDMLQKIAVQKELHAQSARAKKVLLDKLCRGADYAEIAADLEAIERRLTIAEKLLEAFPGYYGRFICLHFARFLGDRVTTEEQRHALGEIMAFLDNVPPLALPNDLRLFFDENTGDYSAEIINAMLEGTKRSIDDPEKFLAENKEAIAQYIEYKQSDEYKHSLAGRLQALLKAFNHASGYYDVFIPAMKRLSKSYAEYARQMEIANEQLLSQYPEIGRWDD